MAPEHATGEVYPPWARASVQELLSLRELADGQPLEVCPANDPVAVQQELPDVHGELLLDLALVALGVLEAILVVQGMRRRRHRQRLRQLPIASVRMVSSAVCSSGVIRNFPIPKVRWAIISGSAASGTRVGRYRK